VHRWAAVGAVLLVLETWVLARWITGPNFTTIPVGVNQPPEWMRICLDTLQIAGFVVAAVVMWRLLIRPLVRERRLTLNGILVIAALFAAPFDAVSAGATQWCNYNSYLFNRGSVLSAIPGVLSPNHAGVGQAWPFFGWPAYVILMPGLGALGAGIMRRARRQYPAMNNVGLIAVCVACVIVLELALEVFLVLPTGVYSPAGMPGPAVFGDTFHRMPVLEALHGGMFFSIPGILKYFVNDRGETFAERGLQAISGGWRRAGVRVAAVTGAFHLGLIVTYHLPVALYAMHSSEYPDDVKKRSYFLGNACGEEVDIACPGPRTPTLRPGAGHFDWSGNFVPPRR
jgi:hypothetical protein